LGEGEPGSGPSVWVRSFNSPFDFREPLFHDAVILHRHMIRGYGWSGAGAIDQIEISVDGGETRRSADVEPPRERFVWARWPCCWMRAARAPIPDVPSNRRGRPRAATGTVLQQHAEFQRHCGLPLTIL
jgi:hypothetical protein